MPELPEVETVVRSISPHLIGHKIHHAHLSSHRVTRGGLSETEAALRGRVIQNVRRRGKQILIQLDVGVVYVHLGMTGKLLWNGVPGTYTRAVIVLDNGTLLYDDVRQFGRIEFFDALPPSLERIGPDALNVPFDEFFERLRQHRGNIKSLLLNQTFVGGIGNIYADELLFAARVHPRTPVSRISKSRAEKVYESALRVLKIAIEHRGSSVSDYVDSAGQPGTFQQLHAVYGREGEPCLRCGTVIRRIVVAQRGTHYCPRCQRA